MPAKPAVNLRFEASDDMAHLVSDAMDVFVDDVFEKNLPVSFPHTLTFCKMAKLKDGRIVGGIVGTSQWNYLEITYIAVHPDFCDRGIGTALMRAAEVAARGELVCNQIHITVLDWQPRSFFEKLGYTVQWTVKNHPRGHTTYNLAKEWHLGWRDEKPVGYEGMSKDVVLADWDAEKATTQLLDWLRAAAARVGVLDVPPCTKVSRGLKALHPDGSLAGICIYHIYWNMLYVYILTVARGRKRGGVGSAMLRKVDDIARENGCEHVTLHTMSWQARPFYEKNGFTVVATQRDLPFTFHRYCLHHHVPELPHSKL